MSDAAVPARRMDLLRDRAARRCAPAFAMWEVTHRCPRRCRHCYLRGEVERDELTTDEGRRLLAAMARMGVLFLTFTGGEPLSREDFPDLADEARRLGFAWKLFTSGAGLGAETARSLARACPLSVEISIHGLEETHDWLTGSPGSFREALGAARTLAGLGLKVEVKMSLTPRGVDDVAPLREELARHGIRLRVSTTLYPYRGGGAPAAELVVSEAELVEHFRRDLGGSVPEPVRGPNSPLCGAGRSTFSVSPRGDVRPCLTMDRICGNVRDEPLERIWTGAGMASVRALVAGARRSCAGCSDAAYCHYCLGLSERETGDPLVPAPSTCREARARQRARAGIGDAAADDAGEDRPGDCAGL